MRFSSLLILMALMLPACAAKKLARRLPGAWYIDHYDEYRYAADSSTGHELDGAGYMSFSKNGRAQRRLRANRPHGALAPFTDFHWRLADSLVSITDAEGHVREEWLVTKDLTDYMEWVSVNTTRDTVRTMYLKK